jgi:multidrug efflux system membrane fusion protein
MDEQVSRTAEAPSRTTPGPAAPPRTAPPPRRSRLRGVIWLVVLGGAAGALLYFHPWSTATPSGGAGGGRAGRYAADAPQAVRVAAAARGDMPVIINALGTVTPLATVTVKTQINGQLIEVAFTEGQIVKRGDFLAQIDPRPYQAALAQAQGTLAHDQALLAEAKIDLARYQKLNSQDSIARQQVDTQQSLVRQYEGTIVTDQALIDTQKLNLVYCHIVSPTDGRVGLRQVDQGNYVQTSDTNGLVVVTQLEPMSVIFTVPEDALTQIMPRLRAGAKLDVVARDRSDTHRIANGQLATVDNQIDTTTGTVKLRAMFDNKDDALFPNQFVNAQLLVNTIRDTVLVPNAAIQRGAPGTYVFLLKPDDTVTVRPVEIGPSDGTNTAISKGLAVGDKVVIDGTDRLREGAKVTIPAARGAGAAAPAGQAAAAEGTTTESATGQKPPGPAPAVDPGGENTTAPADGQPHHHRRRPQDAPAAQ